MLEDVNGCTCRGRGRWDDGSECRACHESARREWEAASAAEGFVRAEDLPSVFRIRTTGPVDAWGRVMRRERHHTTVRVMHHTVRLECDQRVRVES